MTIEARWAASRFQRSPEGGYVAVMTALLLFVFVGLAAFAVDVGQWYVVGQQEQRAADAAALAGVTSLPSDTVKAFAAAQNFSTINGFPDADPKTTVTTELDDGQPTRLRVTVSRTVNNVFGPLLGVPTTTVTRTAVADYAGPVAMGSPCNEFGNDPAPGGHKSANCLATGQFWANVGSKMATKQSGDAYQDGNCSSTADRCSSAAPSGANTDYDLDGYFYTVTLTRNIGTLKLEAFDPAWVAVGDNCTDNGLAGAASDRYEPGASSAFCTGDTVINGASPAAMATRFTVRKEVPSSNPWDPMSYPEVDSSSCTKVFQGFNGSLADPTTLNQVSAGSQKIKDVFRKWVNLCTISSATTGTYMIQVNSNGLGNDPFGKSTDTASAHNRFSLRAYAGSASNDDEIAVAAYNKMAIYANLPDANTLFHLAKVPPGAAGQTLMVRLFDVGDSDMNGDVTVVPPADSNVGSTFNGCVGAGPKSGSLTNCSIVASKATHQGKWQDISVPIPAGYTCDDDVATGCWVKLSYAYGLGAHPNDTTSWTASIQGDPVRLVE